ncbi:MAG: J domain-containing protein [Bacteroidota bacterium]
MKEFVNHYETLGIERDASTEEIKQAFRELALKYHPDKDDTNQFTEQYRMIYQAYEVLKNENSRSQYNYAWDRQFGQTNADNHYDTLQRVRAKRSSRYGRTMYSQRMRYRGTGNAGGNRAEQPFNFTGGKREKRTFAYSTRYADQVVADWENALEVYRKTSFFLRILVGISMLICVALLTDKWQASIGEAATITHLQEPPPVWQNKGLIKIVSTQGIFYVSDEHEFLLLKEKEIYVSRTPWRGKIEAVYIGAGPERRRLNLYNTQFGAAFYSIWLIIIMGSLCMILRKDPEMNFRLCMGTLILSLVIYFSAFYI